MLTKEELHELFEYRDGKLISKISRGGILKGTILGHKHCNKYLRVRANGVLFYVHRVIYVMHYNDNPPEIDHINCNPLDNRIENLRPATKNQNQHNSSLRKDSTSGVKGVTWHELSGKWAARCQVNKKQYNLGVFHNIEEAAETVRLFREKQHGKFYNHGDI